MVAGNGVGDEEAGVGSVHEDGEVFEVVVGVGRGET